MISVIIPFYNSEKHISRCIESILKQTYKNFELILVNDGSTDSSERICNTYKTKDKRIQIIRKQNGGVSSARNIGIKAAKGEYITFVDSDDYLKRDFLSNAIGIFSKRNVDIVKFPYIRKIGPKYFTQKLNIPYHSIIKNRDYIEKIYRNIGLGNTIDTACANVFKTTLIRNIRFDERIEYGEDTLFMIKALELSNNGIYVANTPSYVYVYDKNEATNIFNSTKWIKRLRDFRNIFMSEAIHYISKNREKDIRLEKYFIEKYKLSINGIVHMSIANNSLAKHRNFVKNLIIMLDEKKALSPGNEYYSKINRTCSKSKFIFLKIIYKSKRTIYNILTTVKP